jgi:Domain of unknown function (DUF4365)
VARLRGKAARPRRTREHVIASQSFNYVESFILAQGHTVDHPFEDYGYDMLVSTFDDHGFAESGEILIQMKAADRPRYSSKRDFISFVIDVKHYELWRREPMPVFLIVYDASQRKAYWLYVQEYLRSRKFRRPAKAARTCTLRVPVVNEFGEATVAYARDRKALVLAQIEGKIEHHG